MFWQPGRRQGNEMDDIVLGLKIYALAYIGLLLVVIAVNLAAKKENRSSLKEVCQQCIQLLFSMAIVGVIVLGLTCFLFCVL